MDHFKARKKVCVICYCKGSRVLSSNDAQCVRDFVIEGYSPDDPDYPCAICNNCRRILSDYRNGDTRRSLPVATSYNPETRVLTRSQEVCQCRICDVAKSNGGQAKAMKRKKGRPLSTYSPTKKLCTSCFSALYPGCKHSKAQCLSKKEKLNNIRSNVLSDDLTSQQVASHILHESKAGEITTSVQLSTLGTPLTVHFGPKESALSSEQLSANEAIAMQINAGLSDRQLFKVLKDLRLKFGRKVIESQVQSILVERKTIFADLFSKEMVNFVDSHGKSMIRPFVFCNDISEFISRILFLRGDDDLSTVLKVGFDDGQSVLKLTLSVYDPGDRLVIKTLSNTRALQSQGIGADQDFLKSGVNKIFILAAAPKVSETYQNCKIFLDKVLTDNVSYHFAADLKMTNICLGIMTHAALHPCPYCEGTKNKFEEHAPCRTLDSISENHEKWMNESGKKTTLKHYYNCSNRPLLKSHELSTPTLDIVPPPTLHIKLGIVNKLYDELKKKYPTLDDWPKALFIIKEEYHGQCFEGNECSKLLKNLDMLCNMLPEELQPFHDCFVALQDAMEACFGFTLDSSYKEKVAHFANCYSNLNLSVTTKVHVLIRHVPEFIDRHQKPLGHFCEQVVEQCHSKFNKLFNSYKIKDVNHTNYMRNFFNAIMHFNSYHV